MEQYLNYPIKYAVMELKERKGWIDNYEEITCGFIVSKCYVVDSNIKYYSNGELKISHKVVFPFCIKPSYELSLKDICENPNPTYDLLGNCYLEQTVENIFNTYEEAKIKASQKNESLKEKLCLQVYVFDPNLKENYNELKKEFDKKIEVCQDIEKWIAYHTSLMRVTKNNIVIENEQNQKSPRLIKILIK